MSNSTIKCPYCGKENPSDAIFCMQCGSRLKGDEAKVTQKVKKPKSPGSNKFDVKVLYILIVVLLVVSFAVLYFAGVFSSPKVVVKRSEQKITQPAPVSQKPVIDLKTAQKIKSLEDAVAKNPNNHQMVLDLANTLFDVEEFQKAIKYYRIYIKSHPNIPDVLVDLGVAYFYTGDYKNATKYMQQALKINPKHQIALLNMGIVEKAMGEIEIAKQYWKSAIKISPDNAIGKKAQEFLVNN